MLFWENLNLGWAFSSRPIRPSYQIKPIWHCGRDCIFDKFCAKLDLMDWISHRPRMCKRCQLTTVKSTVFQKQIHCIKYAFMYVFFKCSILVIAATSWPPVADYTRPSKPANHRPQLALIIGECQWAIGGIWRSAVVSCRCRRVISRLWKLRVLGSGCQGVINKFLRSGVSRLWKSVGDQKAENLKFVKDRMTLNHQQCKGHYFLNKCQHCCIVPNSSPQGPPAVNVFVVSLRFPLPSH